MPCWYTLIAHASNYPQPLRHMVKIDEKDMLLNLRLGLLSSTLHLALSLSSSTLGLTLELRSLALDLASRLSSFHLFRTAFDCVSRSSYYWPTNVSL
jgi:hypothetical protein